ncbi:MAG: hypothetical protein U0165_01935 [Polyangiaceae bacterium]
MIVQFQGKKLSLDPATVLGSGGEATVFALDEHTALKIFHTPSRERALKLEAALRRTWPAQVVAPTALVLDAKGSKVIGFAMPRIAHDFEPLSALFRRSARKSLGLTTAALVNLLGSLATTLDALHSNGVIVGDLNDQNELWKLNEPVRLIDADSFQHDGSPCIVATESYLAPELYGVDLSAKPCFTQAHDRYAFAVLAFRALLCVHPFGGSHPSINALTDRVARRLWVLDPSVRYPDKIALPPDTLSAPLRSYFHDVFVAGQRPAFPLSALSDHVASLASCTSCGEESPRSLASCPFCSAARPKVARRTTQARCLGELLAVTNGTFITASVARDARDAIIAIAAEEGRATVYLLDAARPSARVDLGPIEARDRFAILDQGLVVRARGEALDLFDATSGQVVLSTTTATYAGRSSFAVSGTQLVRISAGVILRGSLRGDQLIERPIGTALDQQTNLIPVASNDVILGAHRVFRTINPFKIDNGKFFELPAAKLNDGESLDELHLQSDGSNTLLLRSTREQGAHYTRIDLFDRSGSLACTSRARADADPSRASITGKAFRGDVLLHPTDDGIRHETLRFGSIGDLKLLDDTEPFVSSQSTLIHHPRGLLSMSATQLFLLSPR